MRTLAPMGWSEGMFLKPQHFQQADRFQDERLAYHLRTIDPFHWGVARLQLDVEALENMLLRVLACEVVMPDGLIVRAPDDAVVPEQSFQDEFPSTATSLDVHLAVRSVDGDGSERFARETQARRDVLLATNEAQIEVLVPRARLVFAVGDAEERLAGYDAIRLARIERTGRNAPRFQLAPGHVPPALSVQAAPPLVAMVTEVVERCCAASRTLGQHRRERGAEAIGYGTGDLEQLLARQVLNLFIPRLQHALQSDMTHPWVLYGAIAELHGSLTSFWPDGEAWAFPDYDHDDLAGCFGPLTRAVIALLERLLPVHYLELPLARDGFQFQTAVPDDAFARANAFVLAVRGTESEEALRGRVETHGKVGAIADIPQLVRSALRGVPLRHLAIPPAEIPRYAGHLYFQLDVGDARWAKVRDAASFAFYLADAETDLEARLFVVLGGARASR